MPDQSKRSVKGGGLYGVRGQVGRFVRWDSGKGVAGRSMSSMDDSRLDRIVMIEEDRRVLRVRVRGCPMVTVEGPASGEEEETSSPCLFAKRARLMARVAIVCAC